MRHFNRGECGGDAQEVRGDVTDKNDAEDGENSFGASPHGNTRYVERRADPRGPSVKGESAVFMLQSPVAGPRWVQRLVRFLIR